jgi:hypothetical protein
MVADEVRPETFLKQLPPKVHFTNFPLPVDHHLKIEERRVQKT